MFAVRSGCEGVICCFGPGGQVKDGSSPGELHTSPQTWQKSSLKLQKARADSQTPHASGQIAAARGQATIKQLHDTDVTCLDFFGDIDAATAHSAANEHLEQMPGAGAQLERNIGRQASGAGSGGAAAGGDGQEMGNKAVFGDKSAADRTAQSYTTILATEKVSDADADKRAAAAAAVAERRVAAVKYNFPGAAAPAGSRTHAPDASSPTTWTGLSAAQQQPRVKGSPGPTDDSLSTLAMLSSHTLTDLLGTSSANSDSADGTGPDASSHANAGGPRAMGGVRADAGADTIMWEADDNADKAGAGAQQRDSHVRGADSPASGSPSKFAPRKYASWLFVPRKYATSLFTRDAGASQSTAKRDARAAAARDTLAHALRALSAVPLAINSARGDRDKVVVRKLAVMTYARAGAVAMGIEFTARMAALVRPDLALCDTATISVAAIAQCPREIHMRRAACQPGCLRAGVCDSQSRKCMFFPLIK